MRNMLRSSTLRTVLSLAQAKVVSLGATVIVIEPENSTERLEEGL